MGLFVNVTNKSTNTNLKTEPEDNNRRSLPCL